MRGTGRAYKLNISYIVDERRDPLKATKAAARLLRDNYRILKSWPLALTAYNHGARSMQRARAKVGSDDINKIIAGYKGRRFGFASKNFYATFMATVEISRDPSIYFPDFEKPKAFTYSTILLKKNYTVKELTKHLSIPKKTLKAYNPSIRRSAYRSHLYLPKKFKLKVPPATKEKILAYNNVLEKINSTIGSLDFERMHIVSRGENLYDIARIYHTDFSKIIAFNQIMNPSRIYPGMKIKIPGKKDAITKIAKIKADIVTAKEPLFKEEPKVEPYKETEKPGGYLSKMKSFFGLKAQKKVRVVAKELIATQEKAIPLPAINLASYHLDITHIYDDIFEITIETDETIGHFSDWALIKQDEIRQLNQLRKGAHISLGKKIKIRITKDSISRFKTERNSYHLSTQEDFYSGFKVTGSTDYIIKGGNNLDSILKRNDITFWLARKYQDDGKLSANLQIGQIIKLPVIEALN